MDLKSLVLTGVPNTEFKLTDGRTIKLRAFLVKELKLLMLAKEGGSEDKTIAQVLQQCVLTEGIDVEMLPTFDVERIYLNLFMLSKGTNYTDVAFICQNVVDNKICSHKVKTRVSLKSITLDKDINKDNFIKVNEQMILEMRYPTMIEQDYFKDVRSVEDGTAKVIDMCLNCVSKINAGSETLIVGKDISKEELAELMELVTSSVFEKMVEFIENTPTVHTHVALKCTKCGYEDSVELRGLADFFV